VKEWRIRWLAFGAVVCLAVMALGCTAPARFREIAIGTSSDEVLAVLGAPRSRSRWQKRAPPDHYFGERPNDAYLALAEGAPLETWRYRHFFETWTYTFHLEGLKATLVDKGYDRPGIVY
jgi:hypothetical protein